MAHFAELDGNNVVLGVIVVDNHNILDENGNESEATGIRYIQSILGTGSKWVQTSYNANFRKNYAGIGYTYDQTRDAFIAPNTFPSWTLDDVTCQWTPPVPYPQDGKYYIWNEKVGYWESDI